MSHIVTRKPTSHRESHGEGCDMLTRSVAHQDAAALRPPRDWPRCTQEPSNRSDVKQFPKPERWDTLYWDGIYMWNLMHETIMKLTLNHETPKIPKTPLTSQTLSLGGDTHSLSHIEWVERVHSTQGGRRAPSGSLGIALEVWNAVRCHWIDWIDQLHSIHDLWCTSNLGESCGALFVSLDLELVQFVDGSKFTRFAEAAWLLGSGSFSTRAP